MPSKHQRMKKRYLSYNRSQILVLTLYLSSCAYINKRNYTVILLVIRKLLMNHSPNSHNKSRVLALLASENQRIVELEGDERKQQALLDPSLDCVFLGSHLEEMMERAAEETGVERYGQ